MSIRYRPAPRALSVIALLCPLLSAPLGAEVILMSGDWAELTCQAWNETPELTEGLLKWMENDRDRGFKIIQLYRTDCEDSDWVELRLAEQEGEVRCIRGGWKETEELSKADYVMHALTVRWEQMGNGEYGPMKGMMTRRLRFDGPMFEAMNNMGPFKSFLLLVGAVPSSVEQCPQSGPS